MTELVRVNSEHPGFARLEGMLDRELEVVDGSDNDFYVQFNSNQGLAHVVLCSIGGKAVACGALKAYDETSFELKRMFTDPQHRGKGNALKVLAELEAWAVELGANRILLETGKRQIEALALYQ